MSASSKGMVLLMEMSEKRWFLGSNSKAKAAIIHSPAAWRNCRPIRVRKKTLSRGSVNCASRKALLPFRGIVLLSLA